MRTRKNPMTPLAAVAAGLVAGAVGTVCLDAVHYLKYRRAGEHGQPRSVGVRASRELGGGPGPGAGGQAGARGLHRAQAPRIVRPGSSAPSHTGPTDRGRVRPTASWSAR